MRALHVVRLVGPEVDERRHQHQVGGVRSDEQLVVALAGDQRLRGLERAFRQSRGVAPAFRRGAKRSAQPGARPLRARRQASPRSRTWVQKSQVVAGQPQRADVPLPFVGAAQRIGDHIDPRVLALKMPPSFSGLFRLWAAVMTMECPRRVSSSITRSKCRVFPMLWTRNRIFTTSRAARALEGEENTQVAQLLTLSVQISYYLQVTTRATSFTGFRGTDPPRAASGVQLRRLR